MLFKTYCPLCGQHYTVQNHYRVSLTLCSVNLKLAMMNVLILWFSENGQHGWCIVLCDLSVTSNSACKYYYTQYLYMACYTLYKLIQ